MKSSGAMNTDDDGNSGENVRKGVTHSTIDPFNIQYREFLISAIKINV